MTRNPRALPGALCVAIAALQLLACGEPSPQQLPRTGPLEIGEVTTRITEPLAADGTVDYLGALNAVDRPAPTQNAALPLVRLLGTRALTGDARVVFAQLGVTEELPADGVFAAASFDEDDLLDTIDTALGEISGADELSKSWVDDKELAAWLDRNADALALVVEASRRPRIWWPIVLGPSSGLIDTALPPAALNDVSDALRIRAARSSLRGAFDSAWADAGALLRLGVMLDELPGSTSRMFARAMQRKALEWLRFTMEHAPPDGGQAQAVLDTLRRLPRPRSYVTDVDQFDRYMLLEAMIRGVGGAQVAAPLQPVLRAINASFDDVTAILRSRDAEAHTRLATHVDELSTRLKALAEELQSLPGQIKHAGQALLSQGAHANKLVGEITATTVLVITPIVLKNIRRTEVDRAAAIVALALRIHRLRTGAFPKTLDALVPGTLAALPSLGHVESGLTYRLTEAGCYIGGADEEADWSVELAR